MRSRAALLVGAGKMGHAWARNLIACPNVHMVGWIDIMPGQAARATDELAIEGMWTGDDLHKAIVETRPDFVVDVSTPESHHDVTLTALQAGLPVIGEKPMSTSLESAREMVLASERAGKLYMLSQNRRYLASISAFRQMITDVAGSPGILNSDFYIGAHFGGFRDQMDSPLLLDMAIHTFDAARYVTGADPIRVYCDSFNPSWSWYKGDAAMTAIFEMTGGLRYTARGAWCSEGMHTSWESSWRAVGPRGTVVWDGGDTPSGQSVEKSGGFTSEFMDQSVKTAPGEFEGIAGSLRDFLFALETGAKPMGECHDNFRSLAMVFGAIESARLGARVEVESL